jgi:hypothetical protein
MRYIETEMEAVYRKGYEAIPETPEMGLSQEKIAGDLLPFDSM